MKKLLLAVAVIAFTSPALARGHHRSNSLPEPQGWFNNNFASINAGYGSGVNVIQTGHGTSNTAYVNAFGFSEVVLVQD